MVGRASVLSRDQRQRGLALTWCRRLFAAILILGLAQVEAAPQEARRLAWLVGQQAYPNQRLRTVDQDLQAMASTLKAAGWEVVASSLDADLTALSKEFSALLGHVAENPGAEVFVYLAGHGVESGGDVQLRTIPGTRSGRAAALTGRVSITTLLKGIEASGASLAVIAFDACREPAPAVDHTALGFEKPISRPLVHRMERLVMHATVSGSKAEEGVASGGRFTTELVAALADPAATMQSAFERSRRRVLDSSGGRQRPEMTVSAEAVPVRKPSAPARSQAAAAKSAPDAKQSMLELARRLLGASAQAGIAPLSSDDAETERDIDHVLNLMLPPTDASKRRLEELAGDGSPWASLLLADLLNTGLFQGGDPDRIRALTSHLRRSGAELRLAHLHRQGSHPATTALALLRGVLQRQATAETTALMRGPALAGYLPAQHMYLGSTVLRGVEDETTQLVESQLTARAESGDPAARLTLALARVNRLRLQVGKGAPADGPALRRELVALMSPYVEQGMPPALDVVIRAWLDSQLGPPDLAAVEAVCDKARANKVAMAMTTCARAWAEPPVGSPDPARALSWMREAAALGDLDAANTAGLWLSNGYGGAADPGEGHRLQAQCAARGLIQCMVNAAANLRNGRGGQRDVVRASQLYAKAARLGNNWADTRLAEMMLDEPALRATPADMKQHLLKGLEHDHGGAWELLARVMRAGEAGMPQSLELARGFYQVAAAAGSPGAAARICEMSVLGQGGDREPAHGQQCLQRLADAGNEQAALSLAHLLQHGLGLPKDEERAYEMYEALRRRGNASVAVLVGEFHEHGFGGKPVDLSRARSLYLEAANSGSPDGLAQLAALELRQASTRGLRLGAIEELEDLAVKGNVRATALLAQALLAGGPEVRDPVRGLEMLHSAARLGSHFGRFELARRLLAGDGLPRDVRAAQNLFVILSDENGDRQAMEQLGLIAEEGQATGQVDLSEARRWYQMAAEAGSGLALTKLARFALNGMAEPKDATKAASLLERASRVGHAGATWMLAGLYVSGKGVATDHGRALDLLKQAAAAGDTDAQTDLGYYLMGNAGFEPKVPEGLQWTRKAAAAGHRDAMNNLGSYLHRGLDGARDTARAVELWKSAAEKGSALAMWNLWQVLSAADGVPLDLPQAQRWLKAAADAGHEEAALLLRAH